MNMILLSLFYIKIKYNRSKNFILAFSFANFRQREQFLAIHTLVLNKLDEEHYVFVGD